MIGAAPAIRMREMIKSTITNGVVYLGALDLNVHKPSLARRPGLVVVHGGGWTGGDKDATDIVDISTMFASLGYAVFNIEYTLTGGAPQTPINNILAAVQWVRTNYETYNVDPTRVALLGMSAGGHLGFMAACQGVAGTTRPDVAVGWSPPCTLGELAGTGFTFAASYMGMSYASNPSAWQAKSPRLQITSGCCPIRIVGSASEDTDNGGVAQSQYDNMETAAVAAIGAGNVSKLIKTGSRHSDFGSAAGSATDVFLTSDWIKAKIGGTF